MRITQADIEASIPALQLAIRALTRYQRLRDIYAGTSLR